MTAPNDAESLTRRHLRIGWWALLLFLSLGVALEAMHGFKVGFYLDVSSEARRLTWRLAHAHGTLFALVNIAFAVTVPHLSESASKSRSMASAALAAATLLVPAGFFLGGLFAREGDPGLGVVLVPVGALLLFVAVLVTARSIR